ncbi:MAG: hypothetical protein LBT18_02880 [Endomicrobium sp.]|nr:hypothetical protein [Endomicrobium sp.]
MIKNLSKNVKVSFLYVILFAVMILVSYSTGIAADARKPIEDKIVTFVLNADGTMNKRSLVASKDEPLHLYKTQTFKIKNRNFDNPGDDGAAKIYAIIDIISTEDLRIHGAPQVKLLINRGSYSVDWCEGKLMVYGKESRFSNMRGLTKSQKEMARLLDKVSVDSKGYIDRVITKMATVGEDPKKGFSQMDGHFLANVIRS